MLSDSTFFHVYLNDYINNKFALQSDIKIENMGAI